jgi:hypothetical protein
VRTGRDTDHHLADEYKYLSVWRLALYLEEGLYRKMRRPKLPTLRNSVLRWIHFFRP